MVERPKPVPSGKDGRFVRDSSHNCQIRAISLVLAFFVRVGGNVYLLETKAQGQLTSPNVIRKRKAAVAWCDRINGLAVGHRNGSEWHYVLLGEDAFYGWRDKGGSVGDLLAYAKLRPVQDQTQAKFAF